MTYDLLIYAVGYEERSQYAAIHTDALRRVGVVLASTGNNFSFEKNLAAATSRGDHLSSARGFDGLEEAQTLLEGATRVAVDVSSMPRSLMGAILTAISTHCPESLISVLYSPGMYQKEPTGSFPFVDFNPVVGFEGWSANPELPLSMIVGLGYERDVATGAIEHLDPSGVWAFAPKGFDSRFYRDLLRANQSLEALHRPTRVINYSILDPLLIYTELRSIIEGLIYRSRVVIVPGGPKLFSALSMIAALEVGDEVSLWRVSAHGFVQPRDMKSAGQIITYHHGRLSKAKPPVSFALTQ